METVEIVRCRDCKHREDYGACPRVKLFVDYDGSVMYVDCAPDDGFCEKGESNGTSCRI